MKYALLLLLLFCASCTAPSSKIEPSNYDVWIGCKITPANNNMINMTIRYGGRIELLDALYIALDIIQNKLYKKPIVPFDSNKVQIERKKKKNENIRGNSPDISTMWTYIPIE